MTLVKIPLDSTTAEREVFVQNILDVYSSATKDQRTRGTNWYPSARQIADMATDGDTRTGAAVLAALSPMTDWDTNVMLAVDAIEAGTITRGHFADACSKVNRILAGVNPENVLPMSSKTGQFFRCILDPTDPDPVVIDRHAHDAAYGQRWGNENRGLSTPTRYAILAHAYREAALRSGVIPQVMQAIVWVVWTEN